MNKIIIKHSSVPGVIPAASDLTLGELAINVADGLVFAKQVDGSVKTLAEAIEIKSYAHVAGDVGSITATEAAQGLTMTGGAGLKVTATNATNTLKIDLENADATTLGGHAPSYFATADHLHDDRYLKLQSEGGDYYTQTEVDSNIQQAIDDLMGGASSAYDTLKELEEALKDNDSDIAGINAAIATKLAAADYNADDVLAKIKTVDGSGSNLDADRLDGQHGAYYRNASNLNAGTVPTARLSGIYNIGISGNAATTTKLAAPVNITLSGDASGTVSFDGSANANIDVTVGNDSHTHDTRYYQKGESDGRFARLAGNNTFTADLTVNGKLTAGSAGFKVGEGLEILGEDGYFTNSSYADARILRMLDNNSSDGLVDGGLVIEGYTASDDGRKEVMTLRTNGEFTAFGNTVWHAGNHGEGSGLNADLLDGLHGSQFARIDAPITDLMHIDRSGEALSIGDSSLDSADAWIRIGNGSYDWQIRYHGSTSGNEGNELQLVSQTQGNGLQLDHDGNIEALIGGSKYKIWHSGNHGDGSGLDADTIDGVGSGDLAKLNAKQNFTKSFGVGAVPGNSFENGYAIALNDNDSGIRGNGDGTIEIWGNNKEVAQFRTTGVTMYMKGYATAGLEVTDTLNAKDDIQVGGDSGFQMSFNTATQSLDFNFLGV